VAAQQGKLDADLLSSSSLGTLSIEYDHDYYPFSLEDGGRLAPTVVLLVDRWVINIAVGAR
jgi:hypothetical protein